MNYRRLGKTGLKLSELSFGSWVTFSIQLDESKAGDCMRVAYDAGINFLIMQKDMLMVNQRLLWEKYFLK